MSKAIVQTTSGQQYHAANKAYACHVARELQRQGEQGGVYAVKGNKWRLVERF
jgi:hypothetical protein